MEEYPYQIFVSKGELTEFQCSVEYSITDITYKDYVDYYLDEWIMEVGEKYRPYYYSKFNRNLSGRVFDISDVLYDYSVYVFALLKVELTVGTSKIVVNSDVYVLVNALYKSYIYIVRMVSPYSQNCEYFLEVKLSEKLPYILEDNIGFMEMKYEKNTQILDGYFVVCKEKKVESFLQTNKEKDGIFNYIAFAFLGIGGLVVLIVLGFCGKCRK